MNIGSIFFDGLCQQVRRRMADDFQPVGIGSGHDCHVRILIDHITGIDQFAADAPGDSGTRQSGSDGLGQLGYR